MKKQFSLNTIINILIIVSLLLAVFASLVALGVIQIGEGGIMIWNSYNFVQQRMLAGLGCLE